MTAPKPPRPPARSAPALPGARKPPKPKALKIASVDVGTNSIHTIIAEVHPDGSFEVVDRFKELVRLGHEISESHGMSPRAIADGLAALVRTKSLCDSHQVDRILAAATSAVREAPNGAEFLNLVHKQTGIRIPIVTAHEEARLVHLAVARSLQFNERRALIIDIGGGSVEFIVGSQDELFYVDSVKCGVLRLSQQAPLSDPPTRAEIERLQLHIATQCARVVEEVKQVGFDFVVGTAGTVLALLQQVEGVGRGGKLNHAVVPRRRLEQVRDRLAALAAPERAKLSGLSAQRVDTIVPGAVLLTTIMRLFDAAELHGCVWGLREGVLIDHLERHRRTIKAAPSQPDPRRRSVLALLGRCNWHEKHSRQVASLALMLFDHARALHGLGPAERRLLEYGAYLHDIGYVINAEDHHKHGRYIIINAGLLGFDPREVQILGALARYHRGRLPRKKDIEIEGLARADQRLVGLLGGLLRIGDGLDRTHNSIVDRVDCDLRDGGFEVIVSAHGDAEHEMLHARMKSDLLAETLEIPVRLRLA
ncbi:MAG: Ppx/GppA phosphatase family protein [Candidatus Sumerlaeia bacterium]|nr:Ppx/GppA phosphatase family protein [Candidatus Sumerlaeia bacterium]